MKIFCIDIDGTFIERKGESKTFHECVMSPIQARIDKINKLYDEGHYIKLFTARGTETKLDWRAETNRQLEEYGVKFHELIFGKPYADHYVDDHNMSLEEFDSL